MHPRNPTYRYLKRPYLKPESTFSKPIVFGIWLLVDSGMYVYVLRVRDFLDEHPMTWGWGSWPRILTQRIHVWNIYLHLVDFYGFHEGKYTSSMDPMGNSILRFIGNFGFLVRMIFGHCSESVTRNNTETRPLTAEFHNPIFVFYRVWKKHVPIQLHLKTT